MISGRSNILLFTEIVPKDELNSMTGDEVQNIFYSISTN